jgi:hypothetical protein
MSTNSISILLVLSVLFCLSACGKTTTVDTVSRTINESSLNEVEDTNVKIEIESVEESRVSEKKNERAEQSEVVVNQPDSQNNENQNLHKHKYSKATCIVPKKCVCGVTVGDPLGHHFKSATCTSPEICKRCGAEDAQPRDRYRFDGAWYSDDRGQALAECPYVRKNRKSLLRGEGFDFYR